MVDSLPDPVVITNAANDIIAQNHRAERLLHARDDDSPGRRRALELNNLLFTSFLSKAAMTGGQPVRDRASSTSSIPTKATICCSRCSRIRSANASDRRTPCSRCSATSPTCAAPRTSSSDRCSACARRRSPSAASAIA